MAQDITFVFISIEGHFVPAGRLEMSHSGEGVHLSEFSYGRRYLERKNAIPIDPNELPLTLRTYSTIGQFRAFQDASPDGWGRHLLDLAAEEYGVKPTEFDYLTVLDQENRIGALAFGPDPRKRPEPTTPPWRPDIVHGDTLDLGEMIRVADRVLSHEELAPEHRRFLVRGSSAGGAQPKAVVEYEGRQWIAKFSREFEYWPTCRIELAAMNLAALCSIRIPECKVIEVSGRDVFLIERFDRSRDHIRHHFLSAMTLVGAQDMTEGAYGDIARAIRRYGVADYVKDDLVELFRRMVFNILCNNNDDHLKNHGFLYDPTSKMWRLSPAYDIVPQPREKADGHGFLTLGVGSKGRLATLENALSRCEEFGLSKDEAIKIASEVKNIVSHQWVFENRKALVPEEKIRLVEEAYREAEASSVLWIS